MTIIIKIVPVFLAKLVCLCHSDVKRALSTGVNMTGINKSPSFQYVVINECVIILIFF